MRNGLRCAIRGNRHLSNRKPFSDLHQSRVRNDVARRRFSEEIDIEIGGDGEWHRAIGGENRNVHSEVSKLHHFGARDSAAWAYNAFVKRAPHATPAVVNALDGQAAAGMIPLRKFLRQKLADLLGRHHSRSLLFIHFPQDQPAAASPYFFKVPMPSHAIFETARAGDAIFNKRFTSIVPLLDKRIPLA